MNKAKLLIAASATILLSGPALAAPAQKAIQACRVAVEQNVGDGVLSKLTKVRARGANYEVWLNLKGGDTQQRSYCYLRRGEVEQLVVEDGKWVGRNPRRPETALIG